MLKINNNKNCNIKINDNTISTLSAKEMFKRLGYKLLKKYDDVITYYNVEYDRYIYFYPLTYVIEIGNEDREFNYEELQAINKQVEELGWNI